MQPQQNFGAPGPGDRPCAQCGSPMPKEMRFCRSCGNHLGGGGPAEYTETVRLPGATTQQRGAGTTPFYPTFNAPMATINPGRRRRRMGFAGTTWMWIALVAFFGMGGIMSLARKSHIPRPTFTIGANRSWVGVNQFDTTDGGVTFKYVDMPGGPADKAGLVGGDVITSFDGHPVKSSSEMMDLLVKTPIGKQVAVIYLRDGISHTTQLTTVSREEYSRLEDVYNHRPEGRGQLGFDDGDARRVPIPGTNIYGVQLNDISQNRPLDLAGVKEGDIVIEFDGVPIRSVGELTARDHRALPYSTVKMVVMRGNEKLEIPVKVGKE